MKLALAAAIVLVLAVGLWLQLGQGDGGGRGTAAPSVPAESAHDEAKDARAPAELTAAAAPAAPETPAVAQREEQRPVARGTPPGELPREHQTFALDDARWVDVHVVLPPGLPADDEPTLIAFVPKEEDDGFGEMVAEGLDSYAFLPGVHELAGMDEHVWWSRRPLAPHVRMPFSPDGERGVLLLESDYLRQAPILVALSDTTSVELAPELGAYVAGRCVAPAGHTLVADELELGVVARGDEPRHRFGFGDGWMDVDVRDDLTFELRALAPREGLELVGSAEGLILPAPLELDVQAGRRHELVVAFTPGATLEGVVRGDGAPLAGAAVTASPRGGGQAFVGSESASAESAADGTFRLTGVRPGKVRLGAELDGWRESESRSLEVAEGEVVRGLELVLEAGLRIRGTVQWPDATPAADAEVQALLRQEGGWFQPVGEATSAADGAFVLGGLDAGTFTLMVRHAPPQRTGDAADSSAPELEKVWFGGSGSMWQARVEDVASGAEGVVLTLAEPLPVIGRVVDDTGAPVREFRVNAQPASGVDWMEHASRSFESEDGRFELGVARPGEWTLSVHAVDGEREGEPVTLVVPQGPEPLELVLARGASITGRVLDPTGRPVANASLRVAADAEERMFEDDGDDRGRSAADGSFALADVLSGSTLTASHDAWADSEPLAVDVAPGDSLDGVELRLRRGARITGELHDAAGEPRAGENVNCASGPAAVMTFGNGGRSTTTDAEGRFAFERVPPGRITVMAMPDMQALLERSMDDEEDLDESAYLEAFSNVQSATVEVADGGEAHVVLGAKPKRPVRVHGRVTEAGRAVDAGQVYAVAEGGAVMAGMKLAAIAGGRYELVVDRPGDYVFGINAGETQGMGAPFPVDVPDADELEQDFALPTGRVAGVVLGPDGPADGVALRLVADAGSMGIEDLSRSTMSGAHGAFAFTHLPPGRYTLQAGSDFQGFGTEDPVHAQAVVAGIEVDSDGVEGLRVHLGEPGTLAGIVRDAAGAPLAGLAIFVRDAEGRTIGASSCMTDAAGRFTYEGVAAGIVTCRARGRGHTSAESAPVEVRAGETTTVELTAAAGAFLRVSLLDGDREVRARLRVEDESGRRVDDLVSMEEFATLMSEGTSSRERRVGPLPPGEYTLIATSLDGKDAKKSVRIEAGQEERSVKLRLR